MKLRQEFLSISSVEESEEVYMSKMLHSLAMKYHDKLNQARQILNDTMKIKGEGFFTEALISTHQDRKVILGDIPISFELSGFTIDAKEMASAVIPIDGYSRKKVIDYAMLHGHEASYQENRVFEDSMFWVSGLSAVKGLQILKAMEVPIVELEPYQRYINYNLPDVVITDINNALNKGWKVIVPEETGGLPAFPYIKYDANTGSAGYMIATMAGGYNGYIEADAELLDFISYELMWSGTKKLLSIEFEVIEPKEEKTVALREIFFLHLKMILKWDDGSSKEMAYDSYNTPWGMWVRTGPWIFVRNGLPLPWWYPGRYRIKYDDKVLYQFKIWGVIIDPVSDRYLGITTENGVDTIPNPLNITYDVTTFPEASLSSMTMKIYNSGGGEIRNKPLPATGGQDQTTTWDGKDNSGQIVQPGEYTIRIEAEGDGKKTWSYGYGVVVFRVEITEPTDNKRFDITTAPAMPTINARAEVKGTSTQATYTWELRLTDPDHRVCSELNLSGTESDWTPNFGNTIMGGNYRIKATANISNTFGTDDASGIIRGIDPPRQNIRTAIGNDETAQRIACWESGGMHQFRTDGTPVRGSGIDIGIFQIVTGQTCADVWNWRANVASGLNILNGMRNFATTIPNRVRNRVYRGQGPFPNATNFTAEEAETEAIQRYNTGTGDYAGYWIWDNINQRWVASPPNNYVQNVSSSACP